MHVSVKINFVLCIKHLSILDGYGRIQRHLSGRQNERFIVVLVVLVDIVVIVVIVGMVVIVVALAVIGSK